VPRQSTTQWFIVDVVAGRVVARAALPNRWRLLGGADDSLIVLQRDQFDVESVAVYDVQRR
jgi:hypothetical protein